MSDCILSNKPPNIEPLRARPSCLACANLRRVARRNSADIARAGRPASTPAAAQQRRSPTSCSSWAMISAGCSRASTIAA